MTLPNFPIDKAYLVGGWLASAFWGAFSVLMCVWARSFFQGNGSKTHIVFPIAIVFMYILATVHISLVLTRLVEAFVVHVNDDGGAILYLADIGKPLNRAKDMLYVSSIVSADFILLWRCFMIWNKNYLVIALPTLMVLGTAVSGYGAIGQYFLPDPFVPLSVNWAQAMLAVSMTTNIVVTALTAGRIWYLASQMDAKSFGPSLLRYRSVILLIVESGVFMTVSKVIEFTLFQLAPNDGLNGLNALYIPLDCMPQIMGICPTFIMLAVSTGLAPGTKASSGSRTHPARPNANAYDLKPRAFEQSGHGTVTDSTLSVQVKSERHIQKHADFGTESI